jgi:RNA-directed DNA polymerase
MSGESDKTVSATPILVVAPDKLPKKGAEDRERAKTERTSRIEERRKAALLWKSISEAGGGDAWIASELRRRGLTVDTDPDSLGDDKTSYKERKKAEAAERRVLQKDVRRAYLATHVDFVGHGIFYTDTNDETIREKDERLARARGNDLDGLESPEALATALQLDTPQLRWLCFHRDVQSASHYEYWTIPKRDGSERQITAPKPNLKRVQRWLLQNVVEKLRVHGAAHGFLRGRSIASNASVHSGADVVVKIDVRDFFPTITFRRVKGLFRKGGLPESVATLCALLATESPREIVQFRGRMHYVAKGPRACPQGAPTSPAITNALCLRLDRRMAGLARLLGYGYSRYADDLAFSWRAPEKENASKSDNTTSTQTDSAIKLRAPIGTLLRGVATILENEGFRVNRKKTFVRRAGASQRITGLVVNQVPRDDVPKARVPRETIRRLRAAIHNREQGKPGKEGETLRQLQGMAAFVFMLDPKKGRAFLDRIETLEKKAASENASA